MLGLSLSLLCLWVTAELREELGDKRILFSPEFLREGRALFDSILRVDVPQNVMGATEFHRSYLLPIPSFCNYFVSLLVKQPVLS